MNRFYVLHPQVIHQQSESYPTLNDAINSAIKRNYPVVVVMYEGETTVQFKTEFSKQPVDPMEEGKKR